MIRRLVPILGKIAILPAAALLIPAGMLSVIAPTAAFANADRAAYVLFTAGQRGSTMSGSTDDLLRAKALRWGSEALLYVRDGGHAYVIRDADTLRRARSIFQPQEEMGARQAALGARQAALGQRQAALGIRQARLGLQQGEASPQRARLLSDQQDALGREQSDLGQRQAALGAEQEGLGRQQERLGREADVRFRALVSEAFQRGLARAVD